MNSIIRSAFRLKNLRPLLKTSISTNNLIQQKVLKRNIWYMCISHNENRHKIGLELNKHSDLCGCGRHEVHTKAEKELVEFLSEEILAERKAQKVKTIPTEIDGFKAQLNGSEVTLTKKTDNESIKISFNINHTVDTDSEADMQANLDKPEIGELKSKPAFKIDLVRGETTISLLCSFVGPNEEEGYSDIFGVDEVSIYNGDWHENVYAVSGEVLDSYLYDLLMNYIEEKGITNEFVEKLSAYSTAYENSAYIGLLEGLSKFVSQK